MSTKTPGGSKKKKTKSGRVKSDPSTGKKNGTEHSTVQLAINADTSIIGVPSGVIQPPFTSAPDKEGTSEMPSAAAAVLPVQKSISTLDVQMILEQLNSIDQDVSETSGVNSFTIKGISTVDVSLPTAVELSAEKLNLTYTNILDVDVDVADPYFMSVEGDMHPISDKPLNFHGRDALDTDMEVVANGGDDDEEIAALQSEAASSGPPSSNPGVQKIMNTMMKAKATMLKIKQLGDLNEKKLAENTNSLEYHRQVNVDTRDKREYTYKELLTIFEAGGFTYSDFLDLEPGLLKLSDLVVLKNDSVKFNAHIATLRAITLDMRVARIAEEFDPADFSTTMEYELAKADACCKYTVEYTGKVKHNVNRLQHCISILEGKAFDPALLHSATQKRTDILNKLQEDHIDGIVADLEGLAKGTVTDAEVIKGGQSGRATPVSHIAKHDQVSMPLEECDILSGVGVADCAILEEKLKENIKYIRREHVATCKFMAASLAESRRPVEATGAGGDTELEDCDVEEAVAALALSHEYERQLIAIDEEPPSALDVFLAKLVDWAFKFFFFKMLLCGLGILAVKVVGPDSVNYVCLKLMQAPVASAVNMGLSGLYETLTGSGPLYAIHMLFSAVGWVLGSIDDLIIKYTDYSLKELSNPGVFLYKSNLGRLINTLASTMVVGGAYALLTAPVRAFAFAQVSERRDLWSSIGVRFKAAIKSVTNSAALTSALLASFGVGVIFFAIHNIRDAIYTHSNELSSNKDLILTNYAAVHLNKERWITAHPNISAALDRSCAMIDIFTGYLFEVPYQSLMDEVARLDYINIAGHFTTTATAMELAYAPDIVVKHGSHLLKDLAISDFPDAIVFHTPSGGFGSHRVVDDSGWFTSRSVLTGTQNCGPATELNGLTHKVMVENGYIKYAYSAALLDANSGKELPASVMAVIKIDPFNGCSTIDLAAIDKLSPEDRKIADEFWNSYGFRLREVSGMAHATEINMENDIVAKKVESNKYISFSGDDSSYTTGFVDPGTVMLDNIYCASIATGLFHLYSIASVYKNLAKLYIKTALSAILTPMWNSLKKWHTRKMVERLRNVTLDDDTKENHLAIKAIEAFYGDSYKSIKETDRINEGDLEYDENGYLRLKPDVITEIDEAKGQGTRSKIDKNYAELVRSTLIAMKNDSTTDTAHMFNADLMEEMIEEIATRDPLDFKRRFCLYLEKIESESELDLNLALTTTPVKLEAASLWFKAKSLYLAPKPKSIASINPPLSRMMIYAPNAMKAPREEIFAGVIENKSYNSCGRNPAVTLLGKTPVDGYETQVDDSYSGYYLNAPVASIYNAIENVATVTAEYSNYSLSHLDYGKSGHLRASLFNIIGRSLLSKLTYVYYCINVRTRVLGWNFEEVLCKAVDVAHDIFKGPLSFKKLPASDISVHVVKWNGKVSRELYHTRYYVYMVHLALFSEELENVRKAMIDDIVKLMSLHCWLPDDLTSFDTPYITNKRKALGSSTSPQVTYDKTSLFTLHKNLIVPAMWLFDLARVIGRPCLLLPYSPTTEAKFIRTLRAELVEASERIRGV